MICQNPATVRDGCVNKHFGALLSHTSRMLRRAMDTRIAAEVTPELTGVRGMLLGEIICANNENRDVYQRDVEQWFHIRRSSVTAILQGMEQDGFITRCSVEKDARLSGWPPPPKGWPTTTASEPALTALSRTCNRALPPKKWPLPAWC